MADTSPSRDDAATLAFLGRLGDSHRASDPPTRSGRTARDRFFANRQKTNFWQAFSSDNLAGGGSSGFAAGRIDRLTDHWNPGSIGPNRLFERGGRVMRERARDLVINNPYARSALRKFLVNVIRTGIMPKPQFADRAARKSWVRAFKRWGGHSAHATREADITGDQTYSELQALWLSEIIVAGGCLTNYVELPRKGRTIPLAIELIPEERFADHVTSFGRNPKTANRVHQGMEYDQATGRRIAYHLMPEIPNDVALQNIAPFRLPATTAEYAFFKQRVGQLRGWSLLHAAVIWLYSLGFYADSELAASNVKSQFAAMIKTSTDAEFDWPDLNDSSPDTGACDINGNPLEKLEQGMLWRGAPGDEIVGIGPNVPPSDSMPWLQLIQRSISVAVDQSYEEVTGDYSQGNMSSIRMSAESVRNGYRCLQKFANNHFGHPTWKRFADHGVRAGLDGFPRPAIYQSEMDEWLAVNWSAPNWSSPNPVHDATAREIDKRNGFLTDREVVESRGDDLEDHYDQLKREADDKRLRQLNEPTAEKSTGKPAKASPSPQGTRNRRKAEQRMLAEEME